MPTVQHSSIYFHYSVKGLAMAVKKIGILVPEKEKIIGNNNSDDKLGRIVEFYQQVNISH